MKNSHHGCNNIISSLSTTKAIEVQPVPLNETFNDVFFYFSVQALLCYLIENFIASSSSTVYKVGGISPILKMRAILIIAYGLLTCSCLKERLYVYEWEALTSFLGKSRDKGEIVKHYGNNGAGQAINETMGIYSTDQYQLFLLMYYRALEDPRRTMDASEATSFLIPYDFATDAAYYRINPKDGSTKQFNFRRCKQSDTLQELLRESVYFQRRQGLDHILVVGMNYAMDVYIMKRKCREILELCYNCTKLSIDDYSFLYPDEGRNDPIATSKGRNWMAVPFPSNFHWNPKIELPFVYENTKRHMVASYIGSQDSYWSHAKRMRKWIVNSCVQHPLECTYETYSRSKHRDAHTDFDIHYEISRNSIFCFQPLGDLHTRKGLFDSLLYGCIPVVFDPLSASAMYVWHWSEQLWKLIAVSIEYSKDINFDPVDYLSKYLRDNASDVLRRQQLIRENVFKLQYSVRSKYLVSSWPRDSAGRPMKDAYDISMDAVMGIAVGRISVERNASVPECWSGGVVVRNRCVAKII